MKIVKKKKKVQTGRAVSQALDRRCLSAKTCILSDHKQLGYAVDILALRPGSLQVILVSPVTIIPPVLCTHIQCFSSTEDAT